MNGDEVSGPLVVPVRGQYDGATSTGLSPDVRVSGTSVEIVFVYLWS